MRVREAMDSSEHPRKARKILGSLGLGSNVFKLTETLAALRALSDDDLQEVLGMHRGSLRALQDHAWDFIKTELRLEYVTGGTCVIPMGSFGNSLQVLVRECCSFRELIHTLWRSKPCSQEEPYTLLLYGDECTPGNILNLEYPKKSLVISALIKELVPTVLNVNASWLFLAVVRSNLRGAAVWAAVLRRLFLVEDIATTGVHLDLGASHRAVLYFRMGNVLLDGDAVRMMYAAKRRPVPQRHHRCMVAWRRYNATVVP